MIVNKSVIRCLSFLGILDPSLALFKNDLTFDVKMTFYDLLESLSRFLELLDHCVSDVA